MITYQVESFESLLRSVGDTFQKHYEEVALNKDKIKLNPDYKKYLELEELGCLHTITARNDDKLIGYYLSFLNNHIHYKDHLIAYNDVLYVNPEYRGKGLGKDLFQFAEEKLKELGVSVITIHMKVEHPFKELMESLDYNKVEYIYSKYIGS